MIAARMSFVGGQYGANGSSNWPGSASGDSYGVDVSWQALSSEVWPVAMRGDTAPVVVLTEAEYTALATKDPKTVYVTT